MKTYEGVITHVVDGDTLDVSIDLGFDISLTIRVRIAGVNTPELKDKDLEKSKLAQRAKEFVEEYLYKSVSVTIKGKDIYGRHIAEVGDIGLKLLAKGFAQKVSY
jgi:micrococcal nuclease